MTNYICWIAKVAL